MRGKKLSKIFAIFIFVIIITLIFSQKSNRNSVNTNEYNAYESEDKLFRRLLSTDTVSADKNMSEWVTDYMNCTSPAIANFPYIPTQFRESVYMSLITTFLIIYLFIGTALVCDDYFVPSLEVICDKLNLESDIAGSTFMAAGSSAPELATSLIGVFLTEDDIGLGTIVGSAVFNIAFVVSVCALFAGRVVKINWWPICRDCLFYLISICILLISMSDQSISLFESLTFLLIYAFYILFMSYNKQIENKFSHKLLQLFSGFKSEDPANSLRTSEAPPVWSTGLTVDCIDINIQYNTTNGISDEVNKSVDNSQSIEKSAKNRFRRIGIKVWNIFNSPLNLIHWLTVPDCRKASSRKWFALTFTMACVWISIYSYVIVWMITVIGFNLRIPDTVMSLIFIAGGSSIPDALAGIIVVREGKGDMGVTNAIASNVFDILVCLGLPWFLKTAIINPGSRVEVISRGLEYSTISLLSTVVFFLVITHLNGWKLSIRYGIILMIWYIIFMVLASLIELNVFGQLNPPMCLIF